MDDKKAESKRPYCPSCAHNEYEIMAIKPKNSQVSISVLVCVRCGTMCGVVG